MAEVPTFGIARLAAKECWPASRPTGPDPECTLPEPLYRRIADELERQIESGALAPGAKLLSELELRRRYRASRNTVRDALRWLTIRGRVETRPGQGTFVIQPPEPFITTLSADPDTGLGGGEGSAFRAEVRLRGRQPYTPEPRVEVSRATGIIAAELRIPDGTNRKSTRLNSSH